MEPICNGNCKWQFHELIVELIVLQGPTCESDYHDSWMKKTARKQQRLQFGTSFVQIGFIFIKS